MAPSWPGSSEQEGQPSPVGIKLGSNVAELGRLETYTSIAERLGLKAESDHLHVEAARSTPKRPIIGAFPWPREVTRVWRVLRFDGETAAWMIDVIPADLMPAGKLIERLTAHQMVLDLLLDEGIPVGFSEVEISTALLDPAIRPAGPWG